MAKKYYSTLKIQQEWVKAMCKDYYPPKKDFLWFNSDDENMNIAYHGIAIYHLPKLELAINICDVTDEWSGGRTILDNLSNASVSLTYKETKLKDKRALVYFESEDGSMHCIDKKFLDIVNIEVENYRFYCEDSKKQNIVFITTEAGTFIAGIMEVRC